jgi:hypothetical protein
MRKHDIRSKLGMALALASVMAGPVADATSEAVKATESAVMAPDGAYLRRYRGYRHGKRRNHPRSVEHVRLQAACKRARESGPMRERSAMHSCHEALAQFHGAAS